MTYKNYEGYPDPTASKAVNGVRKEERQQMLEKQHGLKRGQKIVITEMSRDEMHKAAKKKKKTYTVIELYTSLCPSKRSAWHRHMPELCTTQGNNAGRIKQ